MTPYLTCEAAADLLDAFVDLELPMPEQVAVETHLRWCRECEARVAEIQVLGEALRRRRPPATSGGDDDRDLSSVQSSVLARLRAERDQSLSVRLRGLFVDTRFFWPALGASAAVVTCLFGALHVFTAATDDRSRGSLAAIIEILANPGSDENPVNFGPRLSAPRAIDAGAVLDLLKDDEAVYALSAVVTRDGRIASSELLRSEHTSGRRRSRASRTSENVPALREAVRRSRFEPAQNQDGTAVAVNLVWLVARTTVKGSTSAEFVPLRDTPVTVVPHGHRPADVGPGRQSGSADPAISPAA